jgi:hypothetical protein
LNSINQFRKGGREAPFFHAVLSTTLGALKLELPIFTNTKSESLSILLKEKATDPCQWLSIVAGERLELSTSGL